MKFYLVTLLVLSIYAIPTLAKPTRPFILKLVRHDAEMDQKLYITKENDAPISHLSPNHEPPVFLAKLSIGEPPVPQLLHVDTGSSFTWVKCGACNTCQTQLPGYNPTTSSTYSSVSCDDSSYESSPALSPVKRTGECHYREMYFDGSESRGTLAKETILFDTEDDGVESVSNVEFGCAHDIIDGFSVGTGLLGLSYGKFSILKQFSNKFSLCFETFSDDPSSGHSFLALGDGARTTGQSTSLFMRYGHYHVNVERISIDGRTINIPNQLTPIGNTIIDTRTKMLNLAGESYSEFKTHIDSLLEGHLDSFMDGHLVCYNGTIQHDLPLLPTVTLTFYYKGASLELDPTSLFHQLGDEYFCLSVMMSPKIDLSIIGTSALQSYNIGFDLDNETIYFDKISCDYLD